MSKYNIAKFNDDEFECKCGCGLNDMNLSFLKKLEKARLYSKTSYVILSAHRCEKHNKKVGGVPDSSHLKGFAVDIYAPNDNKRFLILYGLIKAGFTRIGVYNDFIHVDDDPSKDKNVSWTKWKI